MSALLYTHWAGFHGLESWFIEENLLNCSRAGSSREIREKGVSDIDWIH
jgi:hypothetical protein